MPTRTVIEARVIPWDKIWGVAISNSDRKREAYPVGSRDDAEREIKRIRAGPLVKA